jgi:hypothetical protein
MSHIRCSLHLPRQMYDMEKRRHDLLNDIKCKDRRTDHFVKDKQDTVHLVRIMFIACHRYCFMSIYIYFQI